MCCVLKSEKLSLFLDFVDCKLIELELSMLKRGRRGFYA
jgi:hypothetical protein